MPSTPVIYTPCFFLGCGSLIGLMVTACFPANGFTPVLIGGAIGGSCGCSYCLLFTYMERKYPDLEIYKPHIVVENMIGKAKSLESNEE
jgi:hypothetical protein